MITTSAVLGAVPPKLNMPSAEFSLQNYIMENEDVALGAMHAGRPLRDLVNKFDAPEAKISKCYALLAEASGVTAAKIPQALAVKLGFIKAFDQEDYINSISKLGNDETLPPEEQLKYLASLGALTGIKPDKDSVDKLGDYKKLLFPASGPADFLLSAAKHNVAVGLPSPAGSLLLLEGAKMPWVRQRMADSSDPSIWALAVLDNFNASPKDIMSGFLRLESMVPKVDNATLSTLCARAWSRPDFVGYIKTTSEMARQQADLGHIELSTMLGKFTKYSPSVVSRIPIIGKDGKPTNDKFLLFTTLEDELEAHSPSQVAIDDLLRSGLEDSQARLRAGFAEAVVASKDDETLSIAARRLLAYTLPASPGQLRFESSTSSYESNAPSFMEKFKGLVQGFTSSIREKFATPLNASPAVTVGDAYQTWEQKDYQIKQIEDMLISEKEASMVPPDTDIDV